MPDADSRPSETANKILASLNDLESRSFFQHLERVTFKQGDVIYEPETRIEHVYFPETAVFSMLCATADGSTIEVGPVGFEGMVGLRVYLGAETARYRVILHIAGEALRLRVGRLKEEVASAKSALAPPLMRYTQMLLAMTGQSCACSGLHTLEQQLARWLLMMSNYVGREMELTHDLMALTLGVRRAGVTEAALRFKEVGLINYTRGRIEIVDRQGLEQRACECYGEIKKEYDLLYADLAGPDHSYPLS